MNLFFTDGAPYGRFNPRLRPSPASALITVSRAPLRPQSPSESRSRWKGKGSTCMSRVVCSPPIPGAVIETWETDDKGAQHLMFVCFFSADGQPSHIFLQPRATTTLSTRNAPHQTDGIGGGRTKKAGTDTARSFSSRIPSPAMWVSSFLFSKPFHVSLGLMSCFFFCYSSVILTKNRALWMSSFRHWGDTNLRPNHLHMMIDAPGLHSLTTAPFPEGDVVLA